MPLQSPSIRSAVCLAVLLLGSGRVCAADKLDPSKLPAASKETIDFARDVQPLLRKNCYSCHGAEQQEGGLRLDQKKRALEGGDEGPVILPSKSGESRLLYLVAGLDEDVGLMPPEGKGSRLTKEQFGILRAWIDQGARWPDGADGALAADHWSFKPIARPPLPQVANRAWFRTPLDAFILARLEKEEIAPSHEASRETLLRRLHFDLVGLPPTPAELHEFLADDRPDAYERLVDRLLASPHFGERWGRHWLDLARYADSDGFEKDAPRPFAWKYRSWVIDALNADMPFDRFTREQLAGDVLPSAGESQRVAVGFHRNTLHNTEGGADPEEDRVKKTIDRTNTLGTVWLGLTVGCAQCHSHKYDPLSQREYFRLYAFFNSLNEVNIDAPTPEQAAAYDAVRQLWEPEQAKRLGAVKAYEAEQLPAKQAAWEQQAANSPAVWTMLEPSSVRSAKGATFKTLSDKSVLVEGKNVLSDVYTIEAATSLKDITAVRLEVLPDQSLVAGGPGRANNGNFVLTTFRVTAAHADGKSAAVPVTFKSARADYSQPQFDPALALNENPADGWAVGHEFGKRHVAVFVAQGPLGVEGGTKLTVTLDQTYNLTEPHNIGRFRLSVATGTDAPPLDGVPADIVALARLAPAERKPEQQKQLAEYYVGLDSELIALKQSLVEHAKKAPALPDQAKAQSVAQLGTPRPTKIHLRGDFLNPGEPVDAGIPAVFPSIKSRSEQPDRLDLANWLLDPANPLTARVAANRLWQQIFGRGLVATSDDFGKQGEPPSHPELLDWLASELAESGWSQKQLLRQIVCSAVYRQSSAARADLVEVDPENVLLARQSRRRVESEVIRDLALASGGLLVPRIGGPSVRPPQPAEYASVTYANSARWEVSKGGDRYRRGLYTFFQRTSPYPMLMTFDTPDSNECAARRSRSNTPLQSLTLWNDPAFFEAAQSLARRIVQSVPAEGRAEDSVHRRATFAFETCLGRSPNPRELAALVELYGKQLRAAESDEKNAASIVGAAPLPPGESTASIAAWVIVGRTLLNLDEFITRE